MGTIISSGVGSGLDVQGLVQKLVQAEGAGKTAQLDTAEAKAQGKLSALGSLRSALASFRDTVAKLKNIESFRGRQVSVSVPDFVSAAAATNASPGSYEVEVDRLAQAHKLQSIGFAAKTTVIGTGTLTLTTGGLNFDVAIDATHNTVAGIAAAINDSPASAHVQATVITGTNGQATLTLTARATGSASAITVAQSGGDGGLASIVFPPNGGGLTQIDAAQNARVLVDGIEVTSATNTISGAIEGVDISVIEVNEDGETSTLTVGYDREAARAAVDSLVKSYNSVVDAIKSIASYNVETRRGGPLFGDAGVRNLGDQLRRELGSSVAGVDTSFDMLAKIGVVAGLDGKLTVDGTKLDAAFTANFDEIGKLFSTPDTGVAIKLDTLLDPYLQTGGVLDGRNASLKASIDDIADRREALSKRLEALQARYLKQFNALDQLLAQLQSTSNFLTQQLSHLPGAVFNND